ncbi:hypothetical protein APR50_40375 [Variovorax paradoxus]|nr:hypothetical protein APR50_40375 [Variovorax paradoxus]KPU93143.1 hypothetical protein APR49_39370 [Variovorax paradoxus]KPV20059.1 hypothetical protein APR48_39245 [Variovorax paradoxus]KPV21486.1 hypothetical protein APR47_38845 [Variovorax paradoxus]
MRLNLSILKHLGIRLYSNSVAVITEAVANAWDADAKHVSIEIKQGAANVIVITDNGVGMSLSDVNDRFLTVGYDRRSDAARSDAIKTPAGRRVMGRKGLGKLSLFSIAETVEIYTRKINEPAQAFKLEVSAIEKEIASGLGEYRPKAIDPSAVAIDPAFVGTRITLSKLKASRIVSAGQLRQRLARRFAVIGPLHDFEVSVDGIPISIADRAYFARLQYIWIFGSPAYREGLEEQLSHYANIKRTNVLSGVVASTGYSVEGWVGTSGEPGDLAQEKNNPEVENLNSIILLARGRPIQENVLGQINDGRLFTKYLVGEINADFLDADDQEDIATSSRQSIIEDDPRYVALKSFTKDALSQIAANWTEFRNEDGERQALQDVPALKEWLTTLSSTEQKTSASRLLARIQSLPIEKKEDRADLFRHGILAFERLRMRHNLSALEALNTFDSHQFRLIVEDVDQIEQSLYLEIVQERLGIIEQLRKLHDKNALERELQTLVFDKLWLIDPSWERGTDALVMEETLGKTFARATALSADERKARLDIRYKRSADSHIIIELKRSERKDLTYKLLYNQGHKYLTGLRKGLASENVTDPYIQVVFLLGAAPKMDLPSDQDLFRGINARYLTYSQLVINASMVYKDYLEKKGQLDPLRRVMDALADSSQDAPPKKKGRQLEPLLLKIPDAGITKARKSAKAISKSPVPSPKKRASGTNIGEPDASPKPRASKKAGASAKKPVAPRKRAKAALNNGR